MTKTDDTKQATKHTPEPWTEEFLPYVSSISCGRETEIPCYRIHPLATPEEYICETNEHLDDEVQYANARRICAAVNAGEGLSTEALEQGIVTELLEACNYVQPHLEEYVRWHHEHQGGCSVEIEQALDLINAAIAKATARAA